jgi:hypothetical protein
MRIQRVIFTAELYVGKSGFAQLAFATPAGEIHGHRGFTFGKRLTSISLFGARMLADVSCTKEWIPVHALID